MKRVFIVSSHPLLGRGIESLLMQERKLEVVGHATNLDQALEELKALQPDVVIVDCSDPDTDHTLTMLSVLREKLQVCVIGLNLHDNTISIYHGQQRTVRRPEDFLDAIQD